MAGKDFVVPRTNGTFAFRRRYPRDLAGHFSKPFRWILLDTHRATEAKILARRKAAEFDTDMARLRIEAGLAKGRELREADIPAPASRFTASALHTDEMERDEDLSESEWEEAGRTHRNRPAGWEEGPGAWRHGLHRRVRQRPPRARVLWHPCRATSAHVVSGGAQVRYRCPDRPR
jgi:hypothetical protein